MTHVLAQPLSFKFIDVNASGLYAQNTSLKHKVWHVSNCMVENLLYTKKKKKEQDGALALFALLKSVTYSALPYTPNVHAQGCVAESVYHNSCTFYRGKQPKVHTHKETQTQTYVFQHPTCILVALCTHFQILSESNFLQDRSLYLINVYDIDKYFYLII